MYSIVGTRFCKPLTAGRQFAGTGILLPRWEDGSWEGLYGLHSNKTIFVICPEDISGSGFYQNREDRPNFVCSDSLCLCICFFVFTVLPNLQKEILHFLGHYEKQDKIFTVTKISTTWKVCYVYLSIHN